MPHRCHQWYCCHRCCDRCLLAETAKRSPRSIVGFANRLVHERRHYQVRRYNSLSLLHTLTPAFGTLELRDGFQHVASQMTFSRFWLLSPALRNGHSVADSHCSGRRLPSVKVLTKWIHTIHTYDTLSENPNRKWIWSSYQIVCLNARNIRRFVFKPCTFVFLQSRNMQVLHLFLPPTLSECSTFIRRIEFLWNKKTLIPRAILCGFGWTNIFHGRKWHEL